MRGLVIPLPSLLPSFLSFLLSFPFVPFSLSHLPPPPPPQVLECAYRIYAKFKHYVDALRIALRLDRRDLVEKAFVDCADPIDRKQQAYLLARQGYVIDMEDGPCKVDDDDLREEMAGIMGNVQLSERYLALARDLDVVEAKAPEDVYKTHLTDVRQPGDNVDSARKNLADTFVNAFVNAGFGHDRLVLPPDAAAESSGDAHWIFKNREHGKMSAAASLGLVMLWDVDNGLSKIDRHMYTSDPHVTAGACLAVGLVSSSVRHEMDPALALLGEKISSPEEEVQVGAALGLGLAYAGTAKEDLLEILGPLVADPETKPDVAAVAALSLGMCFVGTMHDECSGLLLQASVRVCGGECGVIQVNSLALWPPRLASPYLPLKLPPGALLTRGLILPSLPFPPSRRPARSILSPVSVRSASCLAPRSTSAFPRLP